MAPTLTATRGRSSTTASVTVVVKGSRRASLSQPSTSYSPSASSRSNKCDGHIAVRICFCKCGPTRSTMTLRQPSGDGTQDSEAPPKPNRPRSTPNFWLLSGYPVSVKTQTLRQNQIMCVTTRKLIFPPSVCKLIGVKICTLFGAGDPPRFAL